jgi:hypothetical protein
MINFVLLFDGKISRGRVSNYIEATWHSLSSVFDDSHINACVVQGRKLDIHVISGPKLICASCAGAASGGNTENAISYPAASLEVLRLIIKPE